MTSLGTLKSKGKRSWALPERPLALHSAAVLSQRKGGPDLRADGVGVEAPEL